MVPTFPQFHLPARASRVPFGAPAAGGNGAGPVHRPFLQSPPPQSPAPNPLRHDASRGSSRTTRAARGRHDTTLQGDNVMSPRGLRTATKEYFPCPLYPEGRGRRPLPPTGEPRGRPHGGTGQTTTKNNKHKRARPTRRVPRDHYAKLAHGAPRRGVLRTPAGRRHSQGYP